MTTEAQVRAAKGPPEALLAIAQALDRIECLFLAKAVDATSSEWGSWDLEIGTAEPAFTVEEGKDSSVIVIAPVSEKKQKSRAVFANSVIKLDEAFPGIKAEEAYVKGGPVWLYDYDRDFVVGLPFGIKQMIVGDLNEDDPQAALEMGRDILKDGSAGGAPATGGEWV